MVGGAGVVVLVMVLGCFFTIFERSYCFVPPLFTARFFFVFFFFLIRSYICLIGLFFSLPVIPIVFARRGEWNFAVFA